jgi:hypothetical protein
MSTLSSQFANLSVAQQDYFYHLASGSDSTVFDYFEKVPAELRDDPTMVEQYLNGDPELGTPDRDWSHVESVHNGGSNEADNGFFEDMSTNRSRGPADVTPEEAYAAAEESEEDAQTIFEAAEEVSDFTAWAFAAEAAASVGEFAVDAFAPVVGGAVAGKAVADRFTDTKDKLGYGSIASGLTVGFLCTPVGQVCVAGYVGYKVVKRGSKLVQKYQAKHSAAA